MTFELYYRAQGETAADSSLFYGIDENIDDEDRRLLVTSTETDSNLSTMRRDDAKRRGTVATTATARYSSSSATRP